MPHLGEKIKQIRKLKGISQEGLAYAIQRSLATASRIESGQVECTPEMLTTIKRFMDIKNAPLLEHEREMYKSRLLMYDDWLSANRVADVKGMLGKMSCIMDLPFERDFMLMFTLIEAKLLIMEFNLPAAEKKLSRAEAYLDEASDEALYIYLNVKGLCCYYQHDVENALKYYLQALALQKDNSDIKLQINIGTCYFHLGRPYQAIILLENIQRNYYIDSSHPMRHHIVGVIASCYTLIGEYNKAKTLFDEIVLQVKLIGNKLTAGETLSNIGLLYMKLEVYEESINFSNEALTYLPAGWIGYSVTLYQKGLALLKMNRLDECSKVIAYGLSRFESSELSTVLFNVLKHLITLNEMVSIEYIHNTAIPYLRDNSIFKFQALHLCKVLELQYNRKKSRKNASAIAAIMRDIYEEIFFWRD